MAATPAPPEIRNVVNADWLFVVFFSINPQKPEIRTSNYRYFVDDPPFGIALAMLNS
jgi:hypothetical protein